LLSILRCDYNEISTLPDEIPEGLERLYCYHNNIKSLPDSLRFVLDFVDIRLNDNPVYEDIDFDIGGTILEYLDKIELQSK